MLQAGISEVDHMVSICPLGTSGKLVLRANDVTRCLRYSPWPMTESCLGNLWGRHLAA